MSVKRWVVQRKEDEAYLCAYQWVESIFDAEQFEEKQETDDTEECIQVSVTIKPLPKRKGVKS
jgi:hypothetical protein